MPGPASGLRRGTCVGRRQRIAIGRYHGTASSRSRGLSGPAPECRRNRRWCRRKVRSLGVGIYTVATMRARLRPSPGPGRGPRRNDEQAQVPHLDIAGRVRRRPEPERGEPARRGWDAAARVGLPAARLARTARPAGRRGEREHSGHRGVAGERRRRRDGPQDVRTSGRRGLGGRAVEGLVGGGPAVPQRRVRPHPSPTRAFGDGGRDHLPLRDRRDRAGARAGEGGRGRPATCGSGAAPRPFSSTWRRDFWTNSSSHLVPVVLGDGERIFDNLGDTEPQLELVRVVDAPGVTHLKYRVLPSP